MASSKKRAKSSNEQGAILGELRRFLRGVFLQQKRIQPTLLVAYSGGLDSTVLLHALSQLQTELPMCLQAMHINHGISENADDWAIFCTKVCDALDVPLQINKVVVSKASKQGLEAAARKVRYQALLAKPDVDYILLGHHQDDQAETLLLQLARGSGVRGLAAMPQMDLKQRLLRPLLNISRADLLAYAKQYALEWIEDESNVDVQFDRNFMRHEIIPRLQQRFPRISRTLARSAGHMAQTDRLLDDLASLDAKAVIDDQQQYGTLKLPDLFALDMARQANLIRYWLTNLHIEMPSHAVLNQIVSQLASTRTDASIKVKVADGKSIMRYQARAYLVDELNQPLSIDLRWQGEPSITLPNHSRLLFNKVLGEGLSYQRYNNDITLRIKNRNGGERFKRALNRPRCSLKTMLQSIDMPPWQREQLPLIFHDETLVAIPNVAIDPDYKANQDEAGLVIIWLPS